MAARIVTANEKGILHSNITFCLSKHRGLPDDAIRKCRETLIKGGCNYDEAKTFELTCLGLESWEAIKDLMNRTLNIQ